MTKLSVVIAHTSWSDMQLITQVLEKADIAILAVVSDCVSLADQARSLQADAILFSPTLPGVTPGLIQELYLDENHGIAAIGLLPAGSTTYAQEYQRHGMKGFVTTPLDVVQVQRLPDLVRGAVEMTNSERQSRSFVPVTHEEVLELLDQGGWQQQSIAVFSPKGGVGKSTLSANLAVALGVLARRKTLLIDADMSRANVHVLLGLQIEDQPLCSIFSLYERVIADGRDGRYQVRAGVLSKHLRQYRNNLLVLPGIPKMQMAGREEFADVERTEAIFADLLREARGFHEFRIIDVGPDFNMSLHWGALQNADTVLLVVTPERTALQDVANILPALKKKFGTLERFKVVINGYDERFGISLKDMAHFLEGVPIIATLPWDPDRARQAINTNQPIVLERPLSELGAGILKLGAQFYPPLRSLLEKRPVKRQGLFGRVKETFTGVN